MKCASPKGVFDIVPLSEETWRESIRWEYIEQILRQVARDYGFEEIRTPIFERTELFVRGVGESSDIVTKEMYTFLDKGERSMTLRPEGTAPVVRAFVEHQLHTQPTLHKYYYIGPMFRYERQQAGRYRQFYQFGVEAIGTASPEQDVETIDMMVAVYQRLELKSFQLQLNSVGDATSRAQYREALKQHLQPHFQELSLDSQVRFEKNVLRILDSKDPNDQKLLEGAPQLSQFLSAKSRAHFERVLSLLDTLRIAYVLQPKLVRGLDYYTETVFEVTAGELGAQNAIGAGGRYDGLIASLGGPDLPGIGYAIGIERLLQTMLKQDTLFPKRPHPHALFIPIGPEATAFAMSIVSNLRHAHIPCDIDLRQKKVQQGLQLANQLGATYAIIIGENEIHSRRAQIKNMSTRETEDVPLDQLFTALKEKTHV